MLATRLGAAAVERLSAGEHGILLGVTGGQVKATPLSEVAHRTKPVDAALLELAQALAL